MARTPEGKKRSSENSLKHGMRADKARVLADESKEELAAIRKGWLETYRPQGYPAERLLEQLILNDWLLRRANRRLADLEMEAPGEEQERRLALMQRYKTSAERAFYRAYQALEEMRKEAQRDRKWVRAQEKRPMFSDNQSERATGLFDFDQQTKTELGSAGNLLRLRDQARPKSVDR